MTFFDVTAKNVEAHYSKIQKKVVSFLWAFMHQIHTLIIFYSSYCTRVVQMFTMSRSL